MNQHNASFSLAAIVNETQGRDVVLQHGEQKKDRSSPEDVAEQINLCTQSSEQEQWKCRVCSSKE